MAETPQVLRSVQEFIIAFQALQTDKTSAKTQQAILLGQVLLQSLPSVSPLYSLCSCSLAHCLLVTWEKTDAERKRDRELLDIIGSRVSATVDFCPPDSRYREWYLKTQQDYYCIVRNFSARLEDDFWEHEHLNTLNAAVVYAKSAWHVLRNNPTQARHTAENLGNLFSTIAVIMSCRMAPEFQFRSYVQQAMRLSLWSLFEDQPDEMNDTIDYMDQVIQGRTWEIENRGVTTGSGSSYAVALCFLSQVYYRAFIRRRRRGSPAEQYLDQAVLYSEKACAGISDIDPGRLLCMNDFASAQLRLYLKSSSPSVLRGAIDTIISALNLSDDLLTRSGFPRYGGIRMTGQGGSISSLVPIDNRNPTQNQSSLKERRHQRWIVQTLEISADLLLARYKQNQDPRDLTTAIVSLKLSIQGTHAWSPARQKMLFKLNQALRESLRRLKRSNPWQIPNVLRRLSKMDDSFQRLEKLCNDFRSDRAGVNDFFVPLSRSQCVASLLDMQPVRDASWQPIVPRGAYNCDMQLSTDAPNILTSDLVVAAEHVQRAHYQVDPKIDRLLAKLNPEDPETIVIRSMWNRLYCSAAASLTRAEVYQRALAVFIQSGDLGTALELADFAKATLGHIELYLLEPAHYLSEVSHASNLATTVACIWLAHGQDPWNAILVLESGRELGSRHGMNTVRSYGFEPVRELLPQVSGIRDQLQQTARIDQEDGVSNNDRMANQSKDVMTLLEDLARSEAYLTPFGRQQCMWQARNGFVIHLITSKLSTYALITSSDDFQKLHLPLCTHEQLCARAISFRRAIRLCENQEAHKGAANKSLRSMLAWLWKTVAKPVVQCLHLSKSSGSNSNLPRIKWVACGVFSQLPIHAAGIYSGKSNDYMDQYAVSSYLSSIRGSMATQQRKPLIPYYQNQNREFTLFGMSTSPVVPEGKLADLAVAEEQRRIFASLGNSFTNNTIDNCNLGMARNMMHWARIIHFTCHGLAHPTDPSQSRLVLLRDAQEPCTVAKIREMDIPNALLLFLSACHSAIDPQAGETDEIIHLAKAFLLAGFPTVIGTLWQAYQASALDIAAVFYADVAREWTAPQEEPDPDVFPRALHHAVCRWRDSGNLWKPMDWASWVCFTS
ncbi:hypothetical protein MMC30_001163 [Trapelia coarctata]|nr:hypothetical protein [Trapelia coarctata]